jgi:hypothetical protein
MGKLIPPKTCLVESSRVQHLLEPWKIFRSFGCIADVRPDRRSGQPAAKAVGAGGSMAASLPVDFYTRKIDDYSGPKVSLFLATHTIVRLSLSLSAALLIRAHCRPSLL